MILTCHILLGALIGEKIKIVPLVIIIAFISHYLLDFIPHSEYSIDNIKAKRWKKSFPDFLKVILDICFGVFLILIFSKNQPIIFIGALAAVLSDGLNFVNFIFPNKILKFHANLNRKIHFLKDKKISIFWRVATQILTILTICLIHTFFRELVLPLFSFLRILL